ncbi:two-component system sensor histidine kinase YesM [Neobacillus bataviensis]|uniref:histidine kinase n=1 Tax=Neobacillus bataviensis TaxID=220685 RepID=A0A561DZ05_9BACI|nr:sensor histidine kinase [Neobacillus bataviensis]TWE08603.1 two-component system sensor histidine kinase YesM [Neobacillus bataviensis]
MLNIRRLPNRVRNYLQQKILRKIAANIRYKLMFLLLSVMIVPLLILIIFSINVSQRNYEKEVISSNESRIVLAGKYVDEKLKESDKILFASLLDEKLIPSISQTNDENVPMNFSTLNYIKDKLYSIYYRNEHLDRFSIYAKEKSTVYSITEEDFKVSKIANLKGTNWTKLGVNPHYIFDSGGPEQNFSLTRSIIRFEDRKIVGGVSIDVNWNVVDSVIEMLKSEKESSVYLLNKQGQIVYNPNNNKAPAVKFQKIMKQINTSKKNVYYLKDKKGYIFFQKAFNNQVAIVKVIPKTMIMTGVTKTLVYAIIIGIFSIILTVFLSVFISLRTTKPIIKLVDAMHEVEENNFDVRIETDRNDEIGLLEKRFTSMVFRINELIEKEYKSEIATKEAQFKALQAQINPHFLYNTLQLVGGMAVAHNAERIYRVISALSDMFRYITGKQGDMVLIENEIEHIKNYLYIQKQRFDGKIKTDIFVEEGTEGYKIPMLTIQPLVENAFNHGFEQKVGNWKLSVEVQKVFDEIEITITDNGVGIPEEKLKNLFDQINNLSQPLNTRGSIGIKNVAARIGLYFGNEYGLDISSELGIGTQIVIRIPARTLLEV